MDDNGVTVINLFHIDGDIASNTSFSVIAAIHRCIDATGDVDGYTASDIGIIGTAKDFINFGASTPLQMENDISIGISLFTGTIYIVDDQRTIS